MVDISQSDIEKTKEKLNSAHLSQILFSLVKNETLDKKAFFNKKEIYIFSLAVLSVATGSYSPV